jgi:hypothetical protein
VCEQPFLPGAFIRPDIGNRAHHRDCRYSVVEKGHYHALDKQEADARRHVKV